jgi:glycerol-3-phosphate acyltransferase PlsX
MKEGLGSAAGANIAPKAHHLLEYAITASAYARYVLRIDRPRVALLSIGEEDAKGKILGVWRAAWPQ